MNNILFCVGAPKTGTSSFVHWLGSHPEVRASEPKESFFFMDPDHPLAGRHGLSISRDGAAAFRNFFPTWNAARIELEGTTHTFYQSAAREHFAVMQPLPYLVFSLREPAARLLSSFRFTRDNLANCDKALTFEEYVDCLLVGDLQKLDRFYRSEASLWIAKRELALGRYVQWIDWWLERLPPERLRLMLFEQMRAEPCAVVMGLCDWLGVNADWYADYDFSARNATYAVSMQGLHRMIRRLGPLVPRSLIRDKVKAAYLRWQGRGRAPDQSYEEGLRRLRAYFAPYNRELAERYGLALQRWWGEEVLYADR